MNMSDFSMPVIGLGMNMEQRSGQHPQGRPCQHRHTRPRCPIRSQVHSGPKLTQFSNSINPSGHKSSCRSRKAFAITDTELNVIAALAIMGLKSTPTNG